MGLGHHVLVGDVLGRPLIGAGRALREFPLVAEQHVEVAVVPLGRRRRPSPLEARGDGVVALARAEAGVPAQALLFEGSRLGLGAEMGVGRGAVDLAEGVATRDERDRLVVVHRHAPEGVADVLGRGIGIGIAVRALRVHVDQAHLDVGQRALEIALTRVALVGQPLALGAPVDVLLGVPDVLAAAGVAERLEAHRLHGAVAGQHKQIGPGDLLAVFLLDRPQQASGLVEVAVVGPAVDGREALVARRGATAAVTGAIGTGRVPGHPDHQAAVVAIVGRPPVLRIRHQRVEVLLDRVQVELFERLGVVEIGIERIAQGRMLVEDPQVELVGPPILVGRALARGVGVRAVHDRALAHGLGGSSVHSDLRLSVLPLPRSAERDNTCAPAGRRSRATASAPRAAHQKVSGSPRRRLRCTHCAGNARAARQRAPALRCATSATCCVRARAG